MLVLVLVDSSWKSFSRLSAAALKLDMRESRRGNYPLIGAVGKGLAEISQEHEAPPLRADPIVSVRRSVARDYLVCLLCGKKQKLLRRHLSIEHNLAPDQYRKLFNLNPDYPMVAPGYAKQRAELALKIGLGKSLARATKTSARATKRASRLGGDPTTKP
jgi:predicted transcriptional regulator